MRNTSSLFAAIATVLLLSINALAQNASTTASVVKTVQVTASAKEAEVGQQVKLTVVATDASGNAINEKPSAFFAGPFDIAAVDDDGNVKLFGTGQVTVGAIVGGIPGLTTFTVKAPSVKTIEITPLKHRLLVDGSARLDAVTRIFNGDPRTGMPIEWSSDNPKVATVSPGGVVTGVAYGKATITATSGAAKGTTTVSVRMGGMHDMVIATAPQSARTGDVVAFKSNTGPNDDVTVQWAVNGIGATIDDDGRFVAELPGTYIVTATSGMISSHSSVVVTPRNLEREVEVVGRAPFKEFQVAEQWIIGNYA